VSIEAACLEHKVCRGDITLTRSGLEGGMTSYISKLTGAFSNHDFLKWRLTMNIPSNQEHYEKICAIADNWSNFIIGVRDDDWLNVNLKFLASFGKFDRRVFTQHKHAGFTVEFKPIARCLLPLGFTSR
jgi:hypothetical protein